MRLTDKELLDINVTMLRMGEPIELDGQGYNKYDFVSMRYYAGNTSLTSREAYKIVKTLYKYRHTQLKPYCKQIESTMKELKAEMDKDVVDKNKIKILGHDYSEVQFTWSYNSKVSKYLQQEVDRTKYRWTRDGSTWVFNLPWENLDLVSPAFEQNAIDISELRSLKKTVLEESLKALDSSNEYVATVMRLDDSIDTLVLSIKHHPVIEETLNTIPYIKYYKGTNTWEFYIEYATEIYDKLSKAGAAIDLTELKPWSDTVKGWSKYYPSKDFSKVPMKFKPYDFQLKDVADMLDFHRIINANDMGCGKTHESVRVGESLPMKKLVVCPATLRLNWVAEIRIVNPKANIVVLYDNSEFETGDWTVVGYPSVSKHLSNLEKENIQCIFVDEAHYCQAISNSGQPDSQRANAVLRLTATAGWVYPITGTPKTNRNKNLFNILRMIRHPLTRGDWAFHNYGVTYCDGQNNGWGWDYNGNSHDKELHEQIKPYMIRHLKSEVLPDLKKQRVSIPVAVDLREYDEAINEYLNSRTNKEAEQLARLMRARKVLATQKVGETIDFAKDLIKDGDKIVLVTCFTDVIKVLEKAFKGNCVKIVGGMSDSAKEAAKTEFQTGKTQVMLLNILAGGVGITLTAAYNMIINDVDFVPGNLIQVEDRICRSGQTAECSMIYYITASGADVEEEFIDMLTYKSDTINQVIDGGNGESIDFRSLVDKSAGRTRKDKIRKILTAEKVEDSKQKAKPVQGKKKSVPKTTTDSKNVNWKQYSTEELEQMAKDKGLDYVVYDNPGIHRMRLVMLLKKTI